MHFASLGGVLLSIVHYLGGVLQSASHIVHHLSDTLQVPKSYYIRVVEARSAPGRGLVHEFGEQVHEPRVVKRSAVLP